MLCVPLDPAFLFADYAKKDGDRLVAAHVYILVLLGGHAKIPVKISSQLTAFFTSAAIRASTSGVSALRAKATGHRTPSSRLAVSLKPNVA